MTAIVTSYDDNGKVVRRIITAKNKDGSETTVKLDFTKNKDGEVVQCYTI